MYFGFANAPKSFPHLPASSVQKRSARSAVILLGDALLYIRRSIERNMFLCERISVKSVAKPFLASRKVRASLQGQSSASLDTRSGSCLDVP